MPEKTVSLPMEIPVVDKGLQKQISIGSSVLSSSIGTGSKACAGPLILLDGYYTVSDYLNNLVDTDQERMKLKKVICKIMLSVWKSVNIVNPPAIVQLYEVLHPAGTTLTFNYGSTSSDINDCISGNLGCRFIAEFKLKQIITDESYVAWHYELQLNYRPSRSFKQTAKGYDEWEKRMVETADLDTYFPSGTQEDSLDESDEDEEDPGKDISLVWFAKSYADIQWSTQLSSHALGVAILDKITLEKTTKKVKLTLME
jgi:hypothetical protein